MTPNRSTDPRRPLKGLLTASEITALTQRSDARGLWAIVSTWAIVAAAMALVAIWRLVRPGRVTADAWVATADGPRQVAELAGRPFDALMDDLEALDQCVDEFQARGGVGHGMKLLVVPGFLETAKSRT